MTRTNNFRNTEWIEAGYSDMEIKSAVPVGSTYYVVCVFSSESMANKVEFVKTELCKSYDFYVVADFAVIHLQRFFVTFEKRVQVAPNAAIVKSIKTRFIDNRD